MGESIMSYCQVLPVNGLMAVLALAVVLSTPLLRRITCKNELAGPRGHKSGVD